MQYIPEDNLSGIDTLYPTDPVLRAPTAGDSGHTYNFDSGTTDATGDPGSWVPESRCLQDTQGPVDGYSALP